MTTKQSEGSLLSALLAFQADAPHIPLDATNPHFRSKFASLPSIMKIVGPKLAEHGLVWTTRPSQDEQGKPTLKYQLAHAASAESLEDELPLMLSKQDAQGLGSAITYARRYALLAVLGLVADEDDDGNGASRPAPQQQRQAPRPQAAKTDVPADTESFIRAAKSELGAVEEVTGEVVPVTIDQDAAQALKDDMGERKMTAGQIRGFLKGAGVEISDGDNVGKAIDNLTLDQWSSVAKAISVVPKVAAA